MARKDKLYTVNKFNRPAFMPKEENLFLNGGNANALAQADYQKNPWNYTQDYVYGNGPSITDQYLNSKNAFGISKRMNPFSKANLGIAPGGSALKGVGSAMGSALIGGVAGMGAQIIGDTIGGIAGAIGNGVGNLLGGGKKSGVGNAVQSVTGGLGDIVGGVPIVGGLAKGALNLVGGIVGGGVNALVGTKVNQEALNAANKGTSTLNSFTSNASSFDAISGPTAQANVQNAYSGGAFKKGWARRKNAELKQARADARMFADRSIANNVGNLVSDQMNDALANYSAFGGPIDFNDRNMGAIEYGFMSDYLDNGREKAESKNNMTNLFAGVPSSLFADGGGIHIKHPGRLTALKERTGKTEAELWAEGRPEVRKMITFARNARKFKHADGGPLFAFGGDMATNSSDFSTGLMHIDAGGSHEENKYDGVQLGTDSEGTPNLVEENEVVFNDYVFSNRINIDSTTKEKFHLPKKKDITYADLAKRLEKEISERVNDPISKAGFKAQMQTLEEQQERQKQEMEAQRAKEAFESLSPKEQVAVMQQASEQEAMAQQAAQEQQLSAEQQAAMQQQAQMQADGTEAIVGEEPQQFAEGGDTKKKKNVGSWKNDKENHWDVFTKPGLKRYIENLKTQLNMAPDEETKDRIRRQAMNELNTLQQSYYDYVRDGAANATQGYSDNILNHQKMFDKLYGNTGFYSKDNEGNVKNLIAEAINLPNGAATDDKPDNWFDGYNGPRTSIRNFGSTAYGDDKYYQDLVDEFKGLGLSYAPNDNWKDDNGILYGLSIPEAESAKSEAPKVWDWNTGDWIEKPADDASKAKVVTTPSPSTPPAETEDLAPKRKWESLRYAGLLGPAAGLGLMAAGVGRPDTASLDAAVRTGGNVFLADYKPIGDYLTYRPMDIWYEQNALNAQSRATDRALLNSTSPSRMAGLLANSYNSQLASGDLYRKALEYNDAQRERVAGFNRGTNQFNAEAYNRLSQFNVDARNRAAQHQSGLALQAAREKIDADAGWYNSLYGNVAGLFKGIGDLGTENQRNNMLNWMVSKGIFGAVNPDDKEVSKRVEKAGKKACGGKMKKGKRGLTF